jgi:membrane protease YdiL (CAAX protease family)
MIGATGVISVGASVVASWLLAQRDGIYFASPLTTSLLVVCTAACVNAATEELVWRGAALRVLAENFPRNVAIGISSASFGVAHYANGVPGGFFGALAAAILGVALSCLRLAFRSRVFPICAHFIIDVVIPLQI